MPLQATSGAASQDAFGGNGVAVVPAYIEDVFSTYLYTGTGAALTITNNIDLSTKGGLTWIKGRSGATGHRLTDTARGVTKSLESNSDAAQATETTGLTAFGTTGFTIGADADYNTSAATYASWTFRKQPKFFDVLTYSGTGAVQNIAHNLGSVPACIIVKRTDTAGFDWPVYHRSTGNTDRLLLNDTAPSAASSGFWNNTTPTSSVFTVGSNVNTNGSGGTYVAYLFAHDAGGFGLTGTDNVISCGSFTTDGGGAGSVTLGYEPQLIIYKRTDSTSNWTITDNMRGLAATYSSGGVLFPNTSGIETGTNALINATGFTASESGSASYIYIAIRRGPMKVPTTGTSVFSPIASSDTQGTQQTTGFPVDLQLAAYRPGNSYNSTAHDRLRGVSTTSTGNANNSLVTSSTSAEFAAIETQGWNNTGFGIPAFLSSSSSIYWNFRRAPSFFDEVCFTGTGSNIDVTHNLGVTPEFIIGKARGNSTGWICYHKDLGSTGGYPNYIVLNSTNASGSGASTIWRGVSSTTFSYGTNTTLNSSGITYVAYLFATCAGVSKVGSYTGTGTTLQIDCGFTGGARFVLIKRTDSTGDWYVWDSARGIIAGNDPYLLLNSTAAEVTGTDYVDTYSAGFEISSTAPAAINASAGTFIFLAIA